MAFVVKKKIRGNEYYYLNENKRVGGKVKTKTIAYLGKNKALAEEKADQIIKKMEAKKRAIVKENTSPSSKAVEKGNLKQAEISVEELATFCKRKGFVYPSAEIYGGLSGFYDYGHLGFILKKNFQDVWRQYFLNLHENFFEIEASEIMPENVFVASEHLKNFTDVAAKCKKGHIERADHLLEKKLGGKFEGKSPEELLDLIKKNKLLCPVCGSAIDYVGNINMMFPINLGVGNVVKAYLRPETAQSPYVNFKTEFGLLRNKIPLGLALIGKAYRNELSPRNFILRQRAFTQAELQIFFNPSEINEHDNFESVSDYVLQVVLSSEREKGLQKISCSKLAEKIPKFYVYHMAKVQQFYLNILKFSPDRFRLYELNESERAFYNKYHFDMEAKLSDVGWTEIGGVHYRTDHDLKGHQKVSGQNMEVLDEKTGEKFIPHVLELSFGVDRNFYTLMNFSYFYDAERNNVLLKLSPKLSPIKAAVFPIVKKPEYEQIASHVFDLLKEDWNVLYDKSGSIGRRYARNDEIGTPFCITVDEDSLKKKDVTIRDRDTKKQIRVKISELKTFVDGLISGEKQI